MYWFTETVAQPLAWKSLHLPDAGQQRSPNNNQSHLRSLALRFKDLRGPCSRVWVWLLHLPVRAAWILTPGVPSCRAAHHQHPRDPFLDTCKGEPFTVGQLQGHKSSDFKEAQSLAFLCTWGGRNLKKVKNEKKKKKGSFNKIILKVRDEKYLTQCIRIQTITWQLTHRTRHLMVSDRENG